MKREKRQHERKYVSTRLEVHCLLYRDKCDEYTAALNVAKSQYYKANISQCNNQQLFQMIDGLFQVNNTTPLPTHTSLPHLAEEFSSIFQTKIQKLRDNLENSKQLSQDLSVSIPPVHCPTSLLNFTPVTEQFVSDLLQKSPAKSCMLDPVPVHLLKEDIAFIVPPVTNIINASFSEGAFPTSLKNAIIFPSLKKGNPDPEEYNSYRPISNIAFLSKTLERAASIQTTNYLLENDLLAKFQSAYQRYHSTETALICIMNNILREIDSGNEVVLVMLDLSAAFDMIDHALLLERLQHRYGIGGTALKWFQSYLHNRQQSVVVKNTFSSSKPLLHGVPQGSVLGPLLFSLYFAHLEDLIVAHGFVPMIYADDTQLCVAINTSNKSLMLSKLELCTRDILSWCTSNVLSCNPTKTKIAHFMSQFKQYDSIPGIFINGVIIPPVPALPDLGTILDSHLKLNAHVNNICKTAHYAIRSISRIQKYLSQEDCEKLIHAFVTSRLDSCNSMLHGLPEYSISKLQRIQNTAARLVSKTKKSDHITPVLAACSPLASHKIQNCLQDPSHHV